MSPLHPDELALDDHTRPVQTFFDPTGPTDAGAGGVQAPTDGFPAVAGPAGGPEPTDLGLHVDLRAMAQFKDDAVAWAHGLRELIGHSADVWLDAHDLIGYFDAFGRAAHIAESRSISFAIANTPILESTEGDAPIVALRLRDLFAKQTLERAARA